MRSTALRVPDMTLTEVCELARITKSGFRNLRQQGDVPPGFKVGRVLMFHRDDVERWLRTSRFRPVA